MQLVYSTQRQNGHLHQHSQNQEHTFEQISLIITLQFTSQSGLRMHDLGSFGVKLIQKWASGMYTLWIPGPRHQLFLLYSLALRALHLLVNTDIERISSV